MSNDLVKQARDHAAGLERDERENTDYTAALLVSLADEVVRLREALTAMVDEQVDYMTINKLGDPEKQHNIKLARRALAGEQGGDHE
jgi:hypothetical protein